MICVLSVASLRRDDLVLRLFCGYDNREAAGFHTFVHSAIRQTSAPIAVHPLDASGVQEGTNAFTFSRFMVPHRCGYEGRAIFCDASDMLLLADLVELDSYFDPRYAVQVVKHPDYVSRHEKKYVGTEMESRQSNYSRKNWTSVMILNNEHPGWGAVDPQFIASASAGEMLELRFLSDKDIGELPKEWNVLVDEGQDHAGAKLLHWTAGIPGFKRYHNAPRGHEWFAAHYEMSAA